jgi:hypothetical protein
MQHWLIKFCSMSLRQVLGTVLRAIIASLVFLVGIGSLLHYLGLPVPSPYDVLHGFEGLTSLAKILS